MKVKLNLGCCGMIAPGFHNVDLYLPDEQAKGIIDKMKEKDKKNTVFTRAAIQNLPFKDNYADYIETVDMIEHLPFRDIPAAFSEMYRVVKPKGGVCISTTNFDDVVDVWLKESKKLTKMMTKGEDITKMFDPTFSGDDWSTVSSKSINRAMMVIYGNQFHGGEIHMNAFTPAIMYAHLRNAGFKDKNIKIVVHKRGSKAPLMLSQKDLLPDLNGALLNDIIIAEATK